jgi:hypothetical protein
MIGLPRNWSQGTGIAASRPNRTPKRLRRQPLCNELKQDHSKKRRNGSAPAQEIKMHARTVH